MSEERESPRHFKRRQVNGNHRVHHPRAPRRIIAKAVLPGDDPGGIIITALIGIAGAVIGGFVAAALFDAHPLDEFFDISTWLTAIIGAIVLLLIYRLMVGRRASAATTAVRGLHRKRLAAARELATAVSPQSSSRQMYVSTRIASSRAS